MQQRVQDELLYPSLFHTCNNRYSALFYVYDENVPTRPGTLDGRHLIYTAFPNSCKSCWNNPDMKPWSDWNVLGAPTKQKNFVRALTMVFALLFLSGVTSGNRVDVHIMVSKYEFTDQVLSKGPTQSTYTRLRGSSNPLIWLERCEWNLLIWFTYHQTNMTRLAKLRNILS